MRKRVMIVQERIRKKWPEIMVGIDHIIDTTPLGLSIDELTQPIQACSNPAWIIM